MVAGGPFEGVSVFNSVDERSKASATSATGLEKRTGRLDPADSGVPDPNFLFPEEPREIVHVRSFRG